MHKYGEGVRFAGIRNYRLIVIYDLYRRDR